MNGNQEMGAAGGGNNGSGRTGSGIVNGFFAPGPTAKNRNTAAKAAAKASENANMAAGNARKKEVQNFLESSRAGIMNQGPIVGHTYRNQATVNALTARGLAHKFVPEGEPELIVVPRGRVTEELGVANLTNPAVAAAGGSPAGGSPLEPTDAEINAGVMDGGRRSRKARKSKSKKSKKSKSKKSKSRR